MAHSGGIGTAKQDMELHAFSEVLISRPVYLVYMQKTMK